MNTCLVYSTATSSAVAATLQGISIAAFIQSWSVTVMIESYPCDGGNLVIRSIDAMSNCVALGLGYIGCNGALVGLVLFFMHWHSAHPFMYFSMSCCILGHK